MKKTRFLLLSIASIAPLITISSIGCFVSDKEYKQYLKNLKVIDDFEITRPVIKDNKWDEYNRSYNAFKTWLKSRREKAPRNPYANQAFATMNLFLTNANKTYSMWYDAVLNNKSISDDEKIRPEFWEKDLNKNQ
ncbi:hypothetical protein FCM96_00140 [Mycoplasma bovis]|nr:hypothetical protein [Mycoplasmopsis bovis]MBT1345481.1 hypothetical protein [Mycoplasmopsis bovis]MBT1395902.1 hypothetical protein [Mycoplasmopsis bovis]MBT1418413.1 hypothetical protein [Mycoplasmopsis bovis]MBT1419136.1 hypothetical protein [Mycoplasmopsis bovis]UJB25396.1 hypothetical protein FG864_02830 [Mycoplasmopsis bovis]